MSKKFQSRMFRSAAVFNWLVGAVLLINAPMLFNLFGVTPAPPQGVMLHLLAAAIFLFGVGYNWAATDLPGNASLIRLGMIGKASFFGICLVDVVLGVISWQILILLAVDLVYAILFYMALREIRDK